MKKTFLFSIAIFHVVACMAQNTTSASIDQQRRGTIIDSRSAGTALLVFSERGIQRDYTQPVVLSTLPSSALLNPALILMRSENNAGRFNSTYIPNLNIVNAADYIIKVPMIDSGLPGNLTSPVIQILPPLNLPNLPKNLPIVPSIVNPTFRFLNQFFRR